MGANASHNQGREQENSGLQTAEICFVVSTGKIKLSHPEPVGLELGHKEMSPPGYVAMEHKDGAASLPAMLGLSFLACEMDRISSVQTDSPRLLKNT